MALAKLPRKLFDIITLKSLLKKRKSREDTFLSEFLDGVDGVIHVGANIGQEARYYARNKLHVIWVEPIPDVYAKLVQNVSRYPEQRAFKYLLSDVEGKEYDFNVANNQGAASSILELAEATNLWPELAYSEQIKLVSDTFNSFLAKEKIDLADYQGLVLDTQGSELMVIRGLGENVRNFHFIQVEAADFEAYKSCCDVKEITDYLSAFGFSVAAQRKFKENKEWGSYFDIIFVRDHPASD